MVNLLLCLRSERGGLLLVHPALRRHVLRALRVLLRRGGVILEGWLLSEAHPVLGLGLRGWETAHGHWLLHLELIRLSEVQRSLLLKENLVSRLLGRRCAIILVQGR